MKNVIIEMQRIYNTYEKDWMGFKIGKYNFLTFHHIIKKEHGGIEGMYNGALLGNKSHQILNMIEIADINLYQKWNELFKKINDERGPISASNWKAIYNLKKQTVLLNKENNNKRTRKK